MLHFTKKGRCRKICAILSSAKKRYYCEECWKSFTNKTVLIKHLNVTHFSHQCDLCNKTFYKSADLIRHLQMYNRDRKLVTCCKCDKSFISEKSFNYHFKIFQCDQQDDKGNFKHFHSVRLHDGKRWFKCSLCWKKYTCETSVVYHVNSVHLDLKPFYCDRCGMSFVRRFEFSRHCKARVCTRKRQKIKKN